MNHFSQHRDFFNQPPDTTPEPEPDKRAEERQRNRLDLVRPFLNPDGIVSLALLRKLAAHLPDEPINYPDADKTNQMLLWRAARVALIDEIEAMVKQESER